jgi:Immunity protein 53
MMIADADLLKRLQDWYVSQCDGGWEHTYGISIASLDNPGWKFKVDLTGTDLIGRTFDGILFEGKDKNDWYQCRIRNDDFEGHCGPNHLSDVIAIFLNWANGG